MAPAKPDQTEPKPRRTQYPAKAKSRHHHPPRTHAQREHTMNSRTPPTYPFHTDDAVNEPRQSQTWPHTPPNRTTRPITQGAHTIQPILIAATQPNAKPNQVGQRT